MFTPTIRFGMPAYQHRVEQPPRDPQEVRRQALLDAANREFADLRDSVANLRVVIPEGMTPQEFLEAEKMKIFWFLDEQGRFKADAQQPPQKRVRFAGSDKLNDALERMKRLLEELGGDVPQRPDLPVFLQGNKSAPSTRAASLPPNHLNPGIWLDRGQRAQAPAEVSWPGQLDWNLVNNDHIEELLSALTEITQQGLLPWEPDLDITDAFVVKQVQSTDPRSNPVEFYLEPDRLLITNQIGYPLCDAMLEASKSGQKQLSTRSTNFLDREEQDSSEEELQRLQQAFADLQAAVQAYCGSH